MNRCLLLIAIIMLPAASGFGAVDSSFMFGIWTYDLPQVSNPAQFICMLHDTLHFNTIHGHCPNINFRQACENDTLGVISMNGTGDFPGNDTITIWPPVYGESAYSFWQSEGSHIGPRDLVYHGGVNVNVGTDNCRYFTHVGSRVDSLIQTGPADDSGRGYSQIAYYWPQYLAAVHPRNY